MATLTVLKFSVPTGAEAALETVKSLSTRNLITLQDAAIASWPEGKKKNPKVRDLSDLKGAGALSGSFWGLLFGMLFFVPILGMAIGSGLVTAWRRSATPASTTSSSTVSGTRSPPAPRRSSCSPATPSPTASPKR